MQLRYDSDADALYIRFSRTSFDHTTELDSDRRVDYAEDGGVIGVEFTCVKSGIKLDGVPQREAVAGLLATVRAVSLV